MEKVKLYLLGLKGILEISKLPSQQTSSGEDQTWVAEALQVQSPLCQLPRYRRAGYIHRSFPPLQLLGPSFKSKGIVQWEHQPLLNSAHMREAQSMSRNPTAETPSKCKSGKSLTSPSPHPALGEWRSTQRWHALPEVTGWAAALGIESVSWFLAKCFNDQIILLPSVLLLQQDKEGSKQLKAIVWIKLYVRVQSIPRILP